MRVRHAALAFLVIWTFACISTRADVVPAGLIGDHMVLQCGRLLAFWGTASPDEKITVKLADRTGTTRADGQGQWRVKLDPLPAGGPYRLTITGDNTLTFSDVLIGEVWICSGQSNMALSVQRAMNAEQEIAAADQPQIRLFTVPRSPTDEPQTNVKGQWQLCSPESVGSFSAVGYYFGRELHKALNVPIGLINSSAGGTPAEAWTPQPVLEAEADFLPIFERWKERIAKAEAAGSNPQAKRPRAQTQPATRPAVDPRTSPQRPAVLYNGMIHPLIPYRIRGVIWYQGEGNASRAYQYRKLFPTMIRSWREAWRQGDFPFLFVQLANFGEPQKEPFTSPWAELREAQTMTLTLPNTAMAVITDIGDPKDVHPVNKQEVGRRLALAARAIAYGQKIAFSGPLYESMSVEEDRIRVRFEHTGDGLMAAGGGPLKGFLIAGQDRRFVEGEATIDGETVIVHSPKVSEPVAVRYAWADAPEGNLFNKADLPASPFRTDGWPGVTVNEK